jgi:hypothetical protein
MMMTTSNQMRAVPADRRWSCTLAAQYRVAIETQIPFIKECQL